MKRLLLAGPAILIALSFAACGKTEGGAPAAGAHADQLYIEVSARNGLEGYWDHREGLRLVGEELGVKTEFAGPAEYELNAVAAAIAEAVARKPAGILVVGWEESLNGAVDEAIEARIPVVTVATDLPASGRLAFVGTSNLNAGAQLAQWLIKKLNNRGTVAMLGNTALSSIRDRMQGVKSTIAASGLRIVQIGDSKSDAQSAARTAAAILLQFPDLEAMIGIDSYSSLGIGNALKETGKDGTVVATGFGRDTSLLAMIDEGAVAATVVERTALMPYYGALILWQLHNSKLALTEDDAAVKVRNLPSFVDTGIIIVEKEQARTFIRSKQEQAWLE